MKRRYTFIANWKMYFSYNQATAWLEKNKKELETCLEKNPITLIICPSFDALGPSAQALTKSTVALGAQDCSAHEQGAFTGQVWAQSLKELGCTYCIIGHSETYTTWKTDHPVILKKIDRLVAHAIIPIICFGETQEEHAAGTTEKSITEQITTFCRFLHQKKYSNQILFAYEPRWAIGSGKMPTATELEITIKIVQKIMAQHSLLGSILYGGSVSPETLANLKDILGLDGFLLGKASTDFQELKKVVSLLHEG